MSTPVSSQPALFRRMFSLTVHRHCSFRLQMASAGNTINHSSIHMHTVTLALLWMSRECLEEWYSPRKKLQSSTACKSRHFIVVVYCICRTAPYFRQNRNGFKHASITGTLPSDVCGCISCFSTAVGQLPNLRPEFGCRVATGCLSARECPAVPRECATPPDVHCDIQVPHCT